MLPQKIAKSALNGKQFERILTDTGETNIAEWCHMEIDRMPMTKMDWNIRNSLQPMPMHAI